MGKLSLHMARILVTVSPRMYRESLALSIHRNRPGHEVRIASPEDAAEELVRFRPALLVRHDTDGLEGAALSGVPYRFEVCYSDGMDARMGPDGSLHAVRNASTEDLLEAVDEASALAGEEPSRG